MNSLDKFAFLLCIFLNFSRVFANTPVLSSETWLEGIFVPHDVKPGSIIYRFQASDNEPSPDYPLNFSVTGSDVVDTVQVSQTEADLVLKRSLTKGVSYSLRLSVIDWAREETVKNFRVISTEASESEVSPFLTYPKQPIKVSEDIEIGNYVATIIAKRGTDPARSFPDLILTTKTTKFSLSIDFTDNEVQGRIKVAEKLDYETRNFYDLSVMVYRVATNPQLDSRNIIVIRISIIVIDIQDTNPIFKNLPLITRIKNDISQGQTILIAKAEDGDKTLRRQIQYSIHGPNERFFKMDAESGELSTSQPGSEIFRGCSDSAMTLNVTAEERGSRASTDQEIVLFIESSSQSTPNFSSRRYTASVNENPPVLTNLVFEEALHLEVKGNCKLLRISVQDINTGLISETFGVNPTLAVRSTDIEVFVKKPDRLDYENEPKSIFYVIAYSDQTTTGNSVTSTATVTLSLNDVNDNWPIFSQKIYSNSIEERASAGTVVIQVSATDLDGSSSRPIRYTKLIGDAKVIDLFTLHRETGAITLTRSGSLDRETIDRYEFQVEACDEDGHGNCRTAIIKLSIIDDNDNPPQFDQKIYFVCLIDGMRSGETIFQLRAVDKDQPGTNNSRIQYSITYGHAHFDLHSDGRLFLTEDVSKMKHKDKVILGIKATDSGSPQQTSATTVSISSDPQECHRQVIEYVVSQSESEVQRKKEKMEKLLTRLNSGSITRIENIKKVQESSDGNFRTRIMTSVVQQQNQSIVDLTVLEKFHNYPDEPQTVDKETATASTQNTVWKWILIALLILLVIVLLILLCCCLCKPNTKYLKTTQVYNKNKNNTSEVMTHHTARRHHRHRRQNDRILSAPMANGKTNIPYSRHLQDDNSLNSAITRQAQQQQQQQINNSNSAVAKRQQTSMLNVETAEIKRDLSTDLIVQSNVVVSEETPIDGDDNRSRTQLKNQFLEKKSLFTIAYDGMHSRHDLLKDQDYPATTNTPIS